MLLHLLFILISHQGVALAADRKPREGYYPRSAPGGWESRNGVQSYGWDSRRPLSSPSSPCAQCRQSSSSSPATAPGSSSPSDEYRGNGYDNLSPEWQRRDREKTWQSGSGSRFDDRRVWQGSIRPIEGGGRWDDRWEEPRPGGIVTNWMGGPSTSSGDPYRRRDPPYGTGYQQPSWQSDGGYYSGGRGGEGYYDRDRGSYEGVYGRGGCRTGGCSGGPGGGYTGGYGGSNADVGYSDVGGSPPSATGYWGGSSSSSNPYGGGYRGGYAGSYGYSDGGSAPKYNDRGWIPRRPEPSGYDKPSVYYDRSRGESGYLNSCGSSRCQVPKEGGSVSRYDPTRWEENPRWISGVRSEGGSPPKGDNDWGMRNYANGWDYYEQRPGSTHGQGYLYRPPVTSSRIPGESVPWGSEDPGRGTIGTWTRPSGDSYDRPPSNYDRIPPGVYRPSSYDYQGGGGGESGGGYIDDYPNSQRGDYLSSGYRPHVDSGYQYRPSVASYRPSYYRPDDRPPVDGYNRGPSVGGGDYRRGGGGGGGEYRPQVSSGGYEYERPVGGYRPAGSSGAYRPSSGSGNYDLGRYPGHTGVGANFDFDSDKNRGNYYYERPTTSTSSTTPRPSHSSSTEPTSSAS